MHKNKIILFTFCITMIFFSCDLFTYLEDQKKSDKKYNPFIIDPSFQTYEYIQFEDIPENVLNIRQTAATKNSYTIEWDAYPGASEYKIYRYGNTYVETVTSTTYTKTGQRAGFWLYNPDDLLNGGSIMIYPVVSSSDVVIDYVFVPLLFDSNEVIRNNYSDNFNDNSISSIYNFSYYRNTYTYEYGNVNDNNQVYESNNMLNLDSNTTNGYPRFHFVCANYKNKNITIRAKIFGHRVNDYNKTIIRKNDLIIFMAYYENSPPYQYGLYFQNVKDATTDQLTSETKFEEWIDFGFHIDKTTNKVTVYYDNDTYIVDYNDNYDKSGVFLLWFNVSQWYNGNDYKIDDLTITYD